MALNLPRLRISRGEFGRSILFISNPDISNNVKTFFESDTSSGTSTISVNGFGFSADDYVVLGQEGTEKAEIIKISSASNTSITFATNIVYNHSRGEKIQLIQYDKIHIEYKIGIEAGYSNLSNIDIKIDELETAYINDTVYSGTPENVYYRYYFYSSDDGVDFGTESGYSVWVSDNYEGYNTVYSITKRALAQIGEGYSDVVTRDFLIDCLNEGRNLVDQDSRILRWSFRTAFNYNAGNIIPGEWSISAPTDLRDRNTNKNILSIRVGREGRELEYQDKRRFNENYYNIAHTTLNGFLLNGDTSITLTSSGDFDESGEISIAADYVSGTIDTVSYTTNNKSTNIISGVTGMQADEHETGAHVWQGVSFGLPTAYTIDNGTIYFDIPFDNDYAGENIWMDYYKTITHIHDDDETFDEPSPDIYVPYLKWKIKYLKSGGTLKAVEDSDYQEFQSRLKQLIEQEMTGQYVQFIPSE